MTWIHRTLLSLTAMTFLCGLNGSPCDEACADRPVFSPAQLVVESGARASVRCSACQNDCLHEQSGMEASAGHIRKDGNTIFWEADELLEWNVSVTCFNGAGNDTANGTRCCSHLPVTVYQPPSFVFMSLVEAYEGRISGNKFVAECTVGDMAPLGNAVATFYKEEGQSVETIGQLWSQRSSSTPQSHTFALNIGDPRRYLSRYWCEVKLDLGPHGPQPPLVFSSRKVGSNHMLMMSSGSKRNGSFSLGFMLLLLSLFSFHFQCH